MTTMKLYHYNGICRTVQGSDEGPSLTAFKLHLPREPSEDEPLTILPAATSGGFGAPVDDVIRCRWSDPSVRIDWGKEEEVWKRAVCMLPSEQDVEVLSLRLFGTPGRRWIVIFLDRKQQRMMTFLSGYNMRSMRKKRHIAGPNEEGERH